jgi:hypothetical protein
MAGCSYFLHQRHLLVDSLAEQSLFQRQRSCAAVAVMQAAERQQALKRRLRP